ncbi:Carboxylesterase [Trichophaea hybrida]|nr:Carboxylesterase [Trichophaea hybrida]
MLGLYFFLAPFLPTVLAAPLILGITLGPGSNDLPILTLPYAIYTAYSYDVTGLDPKRVEGTPETHTADYYTFKNIGFAAPPTGQRRWAKTEPPLNELGIQDGSVGYQCMQAAPAQLDARGIIVAQPILEAQELMSEDCLFMDVVVPGEAVRGEVKDLPVLMWIYGGGHSIIWIEGLDRVGFISQDDNLRRGLLKSPRPRYDSGGLIKSAKNSSIYAAINYRLGAFSFFSGPTGEAQGTPNTGFHDQRSALKWIQDYIYLLGGNELALTVMGKSAGAVSIFHHLVGNGGTLDPMFQRAILQSPAFEPRYNATRLHSEYTSFETAAGCAQGSGLACLRSKTTEDLQAANLKIVNSA